MTHLEDNTASKKTCLFCINTHFDRNFFQTIFLNGLLPYHRTKFRRTKYFVTFVRRSLVRKGNYVLTWLYVSFMSSFEK